MKKTPAGAKHNEWRRPIEASKHRAGDSGKGEACASKSDDRDGDLADKFWESVVDVENAPETTNLCQLAEAGIGLPKPDALGDAQITAKLWEVIEALARLRVFLSETDHLGDRELYSVLWHDVLRESIPAVLTPTSGAWHVPLCGGGSEEGTRLYLKYYADEDWRTQWSEVFPDYDLPAHEAPPYDRDSRLPRPYPAARVQ